MAKRITITPAIEAKIRAAVGEDIDYSKIAVYEACAASTRPIDQRYSAYNKAQMTEGYLREMASWLPEKTVTLQVMHQDQFLPVGRVFDAEVYPAEEGHFDLNALFYLDESSEHVQSIDLAILDEVSIGATPKHAFCSQCGYDYVQNPESFWFRECDEGHVIGEDGTHLRITALDKWSELSLVNRGASSKPKILGSAKQRLGKEQYAQIAANSPNLDAMYLTATATHNPNPENNLDKEDDMSKELIELSAAKGKLEAQLEASGSKLELRDSQIAELKTKNEELETKLAEVQASGSGQKVKELETQLSEANTAIVAAVDAIKPQYELACTATGKEIDKDANLDTMVAFLKDAQVKLAAIPRGQQTTEQEAEVNTSASQARNDHF